MWNKRASHARIWRTPLKRMTMPRRLPHSFKTKGGKKDSLSLCGTHFIHDQCSFLSRLQALRHLIQTIDGYQFPTNWCTTVEVTWNFSLILQFWQRVQISWLETHTREQGRKDCFNITTDIKHAAWKKKKKKEILTKVANNTHSMSVVSPSNWKGQQKAGPYGEVLKRITKLKM